MGMIDGKEFFTTFPHQPLSGKKVFRRGFISDLRVWRDISQLIGVARSFVFTAPDQTATLGGISRMRVDENLVAL
jgi:hypothetical protein